MRTRPSATFAAVLLAVLFGLTSTPSAVLAADNLATGDIAGQSGDLTNSNTFTIGSTTLTLVKTAFLTDGTELTSGASVPKGTHVRFMVYIDNTTAVAASDVNVADVLDVAFSYQAGTIKVDNSEATAATTADIYAAVNATSVLTDAVDGDVASITGTTVSVGSGTSNAQLNIAASMVWAILFETEVQ
jgi:uncharacterized repeat protein (TIGR01451 family)